MKVSRGRRETQEERQRGRHLITEPNAVSHVIMFPQLFIPVDSKSFRVTLRFSLPAPKLFPFTLDGHPMFLVAIRSFLIMSDDQSDSRDSGKIVPLTPRRSSWRRRDRASELLTNPFALRIA